MKTKTTPAVLTANYHTHTPRCHHAQGVETAYIEAARAAGMQILGFADHAPMIFDEGYVSDFRMLPEQTEIYAMTLDALKHRYAGQISIYIGYEMEYYPRYFARSLASICRYPVDYLILGQHFFENEFPPERAKSRSDGYSGAATDEEWKLGLYVDRVIAGMKTGAFSCVAHPDLIHFIGDDETYRRHIVRLCECAKDMQIPLEINLLGLGGGRAYPNDRFWRIAAEVGCTAILGCDAHTPDMLTDTAVIEDGFRYAEQFGITPVQQLHLRDPHSALNQ
ncbi:MAG: PHP domain-containing protein [Ruminococcaceae bacterium]|nr:PHP domain-containing protein [Oscillospiraceae bacterium]